MSEPRAITGVLVSLGYANRWLVFEHRVNVFGTTMVSELPTEDLRVTSTSPAPGGSAGYTLSVVGTEAGTGAVRTEMEASTVPGVTVVTTPIEVMP
jgi:hypothetical protein